ncbi:MAG TPA: hypothetical protein VK618_10130, partial [Flavitalea sp.]|nr:hypothetical protein [Flavitalea sp.]
GIVTGEGSCTLSVMSCVEEQEQRARAKRTKAERDRVIWLIGGFIIKRFCVLISTFNVRKIA